MSNLRLINETTTTAGVQSVNITEVFSSDFDIYVVMSSNLMANNSTATGANMRLIHSTGIVESGQIYDYGQEAHKGETSKGTNQSSTETRLWNTFGGIDDGGQGAGSTVWIYNPYNNDKYTMLTWRSVGQPGGQLRGYNGIGVYPYFNRITGFQAELNEAAGEFAVGGKIRTYGLRVD